MARTKTYAVPEVGGEAPEFHLPSAQGGQLRLSMRTARGPVVVVFHEGPAEEEVAYFEELAAKEDEINMAGGSVVGIGISEPDEARDFVKKTGIKSYILYDYARVATREYGLLHKSKERGEYARPATFVVDGDHKVVHAWVGERPKAEDLLAKVSEITGLPKKDEPSAEASEEPEGEEKPKKSARKKTEGAGEGDESKAEGEAGGEAGGGERKRLSPEEREKRRVERRAAREGSGKGGARAGEESGAKPGSEGAEAKNAEGGGEKAGGEPESEPAKEE